MDPECKRPENLRASAEDLVPKRWEQDRSPKARSWIYREAALSGAVRSRSGRLARGQSRQTPRLWSRWQEGSEADPGKSCWQSCESWARTGWGTPSFPG